MPLRITAFAFAAGLASTLALAGCVGDDDSALRHICRAEDGGGNVYEASNFELLDALEDALQQCETAAVDPATCIARGCRGE